MTSAAADDDDRRHRGGPVLMSPEDAAAQVRDGDVLAVGGSGGGLLEPGALLKALGERFVRTASPHGLTLLHATGIGDRKGSGMDHLAHHGMHARVVGGNWGNAPGMCELAVAGEFEAYNFPQGVVSQMFREVAAGRPGVITHVGLGTFCDPRRQGGRLNDRTPAELVELVSLAGREWLFYKAVPPSVCFIRGTAADEDGNISFEHEGARLENLAIAQATRNSGGLVIAQVKRYVQRGAIDPKLVLVPGICVDIVVVVPEQRQMDSAEFNPALSGQTRVVLSSLDPLPFDERKIVARRAVQEIRDADVVNLGVGIADGVAAVAAEQGWIDRFTCTIEQGLIGGVPSRGIDFGTSTNPQAMIDAPSQFDFYDGGGIDIAFLGFAQVDRHGNVNVSKFGNKLIGLGGFANISQNARTVVFCGTFTSGGLDARPGDGALAITQEGRHRKFVPEVEQISFAASESLKRGQRVLYVTERAVFRLTSAGLTLCEVAPGVDADADIRSLMAWELEVAADLRPMDARILRPDPLPDDWRSLTTQ
ncbi:propionate CoA-transferase [Brooklawnia cerclae]|uniref:Acyl CoA:acetate/3-ketoacid CoA transferase n=1 Tax=Brooklawnia cerclae TaxID=349934 RepID=A0ABX0SGN5_9ACTN|nr:CoA-transferase [Brooklawnia cerclae]NIH55751.1 acyl CoA:acetate/3-ketoacid CoA transferase [Brooklawnia cerclae]